LFHKLFNNWDTSSPLYALFFYFRSVFLFFSRSAWVYNTPIWICQVAVISGVCYLCETCSVLLTYLIYFLCFWSLWLLTFCIISIIASTWDFVSTSLLLNM
jgi:hypothetical protein